MNYNNFLTKKIQLRDPAGFKPISIPDYLYDFQKSLTEWAIRQGRSAIFAECGLGKTPIQLVWADNVIRKTKKRVLIVTPLAVSYQTIREGEKFGIKCFRSNDGRPRGNITVTNYERLHLFNCNDYIGVVCDESGILKNFDGKRKAIVTEFLRTRPYRLLCTATPSPNDYIELGTTSEALGELGFMDMLGRFFKNDQNTSSTRRAWAITGGGIPKWRFKKHAEEAFWRWICSWARAVRKPSDLGFSDGDFILPPITENQIEIKATRPYSGRLFPEAAVGLKAQREELNTTLQERCEKVAELVNHNNPAITWCHLNKEGDLLEDLIPDAVQVAGKHSDDEKEKRLLDFTNGDIRVLVSKPKIAGFGLNWQHCSHIIYFPSNSFEQMYQSIRRCWRFGQKNPVTVDIVTTPGMNLALKNLQRKSLAADKMFSSLVKFMNDYLKIKPVERFHNRMEKPQWL